MKARRVVCLIMLLSAVDQAVKLWVFFRGMGKSLTLIPGVLLYHPVQNTHLSYIGSLVNTKIPLPVMILLEITGAFFIVMIYRYCRFMPGGGRKLPFCFLVFGLSGVLCGFLDNTLWGGSIDYICLFDWFTFDIKDVYLSSMSALMVLSMLCSMPAYYGLNEEERKKYDLLPWIKKGCPAGEHNSAKRD